MVVLNNVLNFRLSWYLEECLSSVGIANTLKKYKYDTVRRNVGLFPHWAKFIQ